MRSEPDGGSRATTTRAALRVGGGVAAVVALVLLGRLFGDSLPAFLASIERMGAWGPIAFAAGYALATVAFLPGSVLTLASGALFGLGVGAASSFAGAVAGSSLAFLVARTILRGPVERRLARDPRFAAIDRAIGDQGLRIVFLLRLSPVVPFNLLNYALGLTRIRFVHALIASLGMLPGCLLYAYTGRIAADVAKLAAGEPVPRSAAHHVLLGLGLVATVLVTALVTRLARRALAEATRES